MYLLKIKRREDSTPNIKLSFTNEYKEFEKMNKLIEFVYTQALYIESYEIFEMKPFEQKDSVVNPNRNSHISISG